MQFTSKLTLLAAAAATVSCTNTVTFVNQDDTTRHVVFTPSSGHEEIETVTISGSNTHTATIPESWVGNWYAYKEGSEASTGMLGEVTFNGWGGITYFDVSAIINSADTDNVKMIYPASEADATTKTTFSGCNNFMCATVYVNPDDLQTVSTMETDLICTLGTASGSGTSTSSSSSGTTTSVPATSGSASSAKKARKSKKCANKKRHSHSMKRDESRSGVELFSRDYVMGNL